MEIYNCISNSIHQTFCEQFSVLAVAVLSVPDDLLDPGLDRGHPGVHPGEVGVGAAVPEADHADLCVSERDRNCEKWLVVDECFYLPFSETNIGPPESP